MYIQITNRCNMKCAHCGFACTAIGHDMTMETYRKACELAEKLDDFICIGGGEPTLHKDFWAFVGITNEYTQYQFTAVTNGSITKTALKLADLNVYGGPIRTTLSLDEYHDKIDPKVVKAFSFNILETKKEEVIPAGRAEKWGVDAETCICEELFCDPLGNLYSCGCKTEHFGTVYDPKIPAFFTKETRCPKLRKLANAA